jgi:hypothetical protein
MRWAWLVLATACRFDQGAVRGDAAVVTDDADIDGAIDTAVATARSPATSSRVCTDALLPS